jgi:hypothetical protein
VLFETLGLNKGVALFIVNSTRKCQIKFDLEDPNRWNISKLDGGTGFPEAL